ncbi:protein of unknown function DUF929 [Metallosphaera sedula]|uniref:DUF929 domain-containing protein n=3 Tax=Metallosphaera TaxID=41980 RepID=A4YE62_METS5|nr:MULTISPECIES: DUF929 domain-containing protein [Metallosphaera]ABP94714.1 protein of unknown function DUF929 [Metallosphaera sedula DSM 5348]AIM26701.1 protein of unknown function DUF929 [Metallosphaera sedula]AKV73663.1 hypothetical protein MsedA_0551 [Metallosphaera sedula]AKV75903.1 hypothetical protein MsedB_0551 [Metallosphaera sedula]AKV78154.1 hypothetical protein MsedC_0550 [Metallosphaera sedula]
MYSSRILAIVAVIVVVVSFLSLYFSRIYVTSAQSIPAGQFVKISNQDLAPKGKIIIVEQSWIGCPVGAAASWSIYDALKNYGNFSYQLHYSDPLHSPASIPGLIFTQFNSTSVVQFYVAYVYNEYLNASYNGTPIPESQLVQAGEQILTQEYSQMGLPPQVSQLIIKYETQVPVTSYGKPSALYVNPPHLNFAILISGPGGTYIVTTPIVNPNILSGYSPEYVLTHIDQFTQIIQGAQLIQNATLEAAGPLASECPT